MKRFAWRGEVIVARLDELEMAILLAVPALIAGVGEVGIDPAASRLEPAIHREDSERSAEFLRLAAGLIDEGRSADLALFAACLERAETEDWLTRQEAEAWIRVLTTARLILGARLGIADDGWEDDGDVERDDPRVIALYILGMLQEDLVDALTATL